MLEHFIENRKERIIPLESPPANAIVKFGEKLELTFPAICVMQLGITFDTDKIPIAVGLIKRLANSKSTPVIKRTPHCVTTFQIPAENICQIVFMLKHLKFIFKSGKIFLLMMK